jgi:hypothetical protein
LIAVKNLSKFPFSSIIYFQHIVGFYGVIYLVYYAYDGKELEVEDLKNLFHSRLDSKLIHGLDKFDEITNVSETDVEYIIALKNLRWENSNAQNFLKDLNNLKSLIGQEIFGLTYPMHIHKSEVEFITLIAGCSAVNDERKRINKQDIIKAYTTYFKLLKQI